MNLTQAFVDFALLGAEWVMWLLVVLSVVSIAVMVDRALWFRGRETDTVAARDQLRAAFAGGDLGALARTWRASPAIAHQVAARGLDAVDGGAAAAAEAMHGERVRWRTDADRNLIVLGTLGNNVPFVGLFGTVLGVIKAFDELKSKGAAGEEAVMAGIAEALAATAIGLLVAIPAVVAFNYFGRRVKVLLGSADELAHAVLSGIHGRGPGGGG
ncbi:MAG: MotA/TolQ/ExbB proton channel family protein [Kofleriaceae bacterium]|nr:MotA/TolQ/ExbB proton channel family protein [Kofleriaceae bacterium]MCL4223857.1 MotA/TolQ/ExbB proton channel family protein [Myxococcales bacterium]